ncbi:hypothetical protein CHS0354_006900 [Potamilus streckersoni]|uniref:Clp R domain-containing protein n=1 Tax=Potamilus streckersoni TaxID=2493646 RepID=A0AAE0TEI9_9BIVA|nr:hypothetical protein CHS0354_006900 [Potamilus streckersoni]
MQKADGTNLSLEHLLLALLDDANTALIIRNCGADINDLKTKLDEFLETRIERVPNGIEYEPVRTISFKRVMRRVTAHVIVAGKKSVSGADVIVAFYKEQDSFALYFLKSCGVRRIDILNNLSHIFGSAQEDIKIRIETEKDTEKDTEKTTSGHNKTLSMFAADLNARAQEGKLGPAYRQKIGTGTDDTGAVPPEKGTTRYWWVNRVSVPRNRQRLIGRLHMLKPILSGDEVRFIGATTYKDTATDLKRTPRWQGGFRRLILLNPRIKSCGRIIRPLHHGRFLPDKAIDVIDEAGAESAIKRQNARRIKIGISEIEDIVSRITGIPVQKMDADSGKKLKNLDTELKQTVFGQDEAIERVVSAIKRNKAGMRTTEKPIGSFLFIGPTGVGKTEISKQLAAILNIHFERFDMSEYAEKHAVARLIGAPPGYIGFEQGGLLVEAMRKHPHSVLLLDEIEKAHPDIFNILLQVMDHSRLTDNTGNTADFRNVI